MTASRGRIALYAVICGILAAPFFLLRDIPFFDLPAHIAREHLLFDPALANARQYYIVDWRLLPNLAIDLVVFALHFVVSVDTSVRLFLAITVIQLFLGAVALNRALQGPDRRFDLPAALFVFNGPLLLGLVNLVFGFGMTLWVFALWLRWTGRRFAWALFAVLGTLILVAHLFAFAVYAMCVTAHTCSSIYRARPKLAMAAGILLRQCGPLIVPAAVYFLGMPANLRESGVFASTIKYKLWALATIGGIYNLQFDVGFLLLVGYAGFTLRSRLDWAGQMGWPLVALAVTFLLLPYQIGQGTWVDYRIPAIFLLLLLASIGWRGSPEGRRRTEYAILAVFALRMTVLMLQWWSWQPVYQSYREAFRMMPEGARLLPLGTHPDTIIASEHPPMAHMDALAISERGAFIPTMLADRPSELLHYAPAVAGIKGAFLEAPDIHDYDYVMILGPASETVPAGIEEVARQPSFLLGRVIR